MGGEAVTNYEDANRGRFQNESYAKQLISFDGMLFEGKSGITNVTPTDIDGLVHLSKENCIIFFELKHSGGMPGGQREALEKLNDAVMAGKTNTILFLATHNTPKDQTVIAKYALVQGCYWGGKWRKFAEPTTLYEAMDRYIQWLRKGLNRKKGKQG